MKFTVSFKTPDALDAAIQDIIMEQGAISDENRDTVKETFDLFVQFGEYVTIDFDTDTKTATVKKI